MGINSKAVQSYCCRTLVVMAKRPGLGRVKTRLGKDIGPVEATRFYRHNLAVLLGRFRGEKRWNTVVSVSPDQAVPFFSVLPDQQAIGQGRGDLGKRMQSVFMDMPPGPVLIVGSDIPQITPARISAAFRTLGQADIVLGAGEDGGYWLVGMKRTPAVLQGIFRDVTWSSAQTFDDTVKNLSGRNVVILDVLNDIDDGQDYARWQAEGMMF